MVGNSGIGCKMQFRRAGRGDVATITELVRSTYARWVPIIGREPLPMTADYDQAVSNHIIELALLNEQVVGLIELVQDRDCIVLENVAVRTADCGKGYGQALVARAIHLTRAMGHNRMRLCTNKLMARNISIYKKMGFVIDREERTPDGRDAVHMGLSV